MIMSSALITNGRLAEFGGSELVALEIAEELQRMGWDVLLFSPFVGEPLRSCISVAYTTTMPDTSRFDLLWIHHNMLIHKLGFKKASHQRIIFNHMSSYVPAEWPKLPVTEQRLADVILANSEETRAMLKLDDVQLFQNPSPPCGEVMDKVDEPLLVSNHPPDELIGIGGDRVGYHAPRRITPSVLSKYPYVICNGKTVQYALRAGVPVYLYDHFGGPGWLTPDNFERAERFNFSGRGFGAKDRHTIEQELRVIPEPLECPDRFKLEVCLEKILS